MKDSKNLTPRSLHSALCDSSRCAQRSEAESRAPSLSPRAIRHEYQTLLRTTRSQAVTKLVELGMAYKDKRQHISALACFRRALVHARCPSKAPAKPMPVQHECAKIRTDTYSTAQVIKSRNKTSNVDVEDKNFFPTFVPRPPSRNCRGRRKPAFDKRKHTMADPRPTELTLYYQNPQIFPSLRPRRPPRIVQPHQLFCLIQSKRFNIVVKSQEHTRYFRQDRRRYTSSSAYHSITSSGSSLRQWTAKSSR